MFAFTVRQIEIFLAVCEAGSFRRAAERAQISEAGVSNHIRALEAQLDCPLFARRRGAKIRLLEAGIAFREEALAFVQRGRELRTAAARTKRSEPLKSFVGGHLLEDVIRPALPAFLRAHPDIGLDFILGRTREQVRHDVLSGSLDMVLLAVQTADDLPGSIFLSHVEAGIYGNADLAARVAQHGLASVPFIMDRIGTESERSQRRRLKQMGVAKPIVAMHSQFHDASIVSAAQGQGAIMTLRSMVDAHDRARALRLIHPLPSWERRLYLREDLPPETQRAVLEFVRDALDKFSGSVPPGSDIGRDDM